MIKEIAILILCTAFVSLAYSKDIYRWVDENGQTHIEDSVPPRYRDSAKKVDSRQFELTESQRQEAAARAAKEKARLAASSNKTTGVSNTAEAASTPPPASNDSNATECERLWKAYRESQECFAPFMRVTGGTRSDAYQKCTQVAEPTGNCDASKLGH